MQIQELLNSYLLEDLSVPYQEHSNEYLEHLKIHFALFKLKFNRPMLVDRSLRRKVLKLSMIEMARSIVGESKFRLIYAFQHLGFVEEEIRMLQSKKWWIRAHACRNIAIMQAASAVPHIVKLLEDEEPDVRIESAQALIDIVGVDVLSSILLTIHHFSMWEKIRIARSIMTMGSDAVPQLIKGLQSEITVVKEFCIEMLGSLGDISAVPVILEYIGYQVPSVQKASLLALGKLGDERAIPIIMNFLNHENFTLRAAAAQAAGYLAAPKFVFPLHAILMHNAIEEKIIAAESLSKIEEKGILALKNAFQSGNSVVQSIAIQFLHEKGIIMEAHR